MGGAAGSGVFAATSRSATEQLGDTYPRGMAHITARGGVCLVFSAGTSDAQGQDAEAGDLDGAGDADTLSFAEVA